MDTPVLELIGISKRYPGGKLAVDNVSISASRGEIICLAGENGAGKTTLMKILYGMEPQTEGSIKINGVETQFSSASEAIEKGIGMVHQHFMLVNDFSVAENIVMGMEPKISKLFINKKLMYQDVQRKLDQYGFKLNAREKVRNLSVGAMQQTEIMKMLFRNDEILILDEPTAVLTEAEIDSLFKNLEGLARTGKTIILITHKLNEIKKISDKVVILSKGKLVGVYPTADLTQQQMARLMFGKRELFSIQKRVDAALNPVILSCEGISVRKSSQEKRLLSNISLEVHKSEILGIAGLSGNGLGVLEGVLGGFIKVSSGALVHNGENITNLGTKVFRKLGLSYVPAKRISMGSSPNSSVKDNLIAGDLEHFSNGMFLDDKKIDSHVDKLINSYLIEASPNMMASELSGGNIQKLILAREIDKATDFILFSQPTWGLDQESSTFVYRQISALRDKGLAVVVISYNIDEILSISDRIAVFCRGCLVKLTNNDNSYSRKDIGNMMLGLSVENRSFPQGGENE